MEQNRVACRSQLTSCNVSAASPSQATNPTKSTSSTAHLECALSCTLDMLTRGVCPVFVFNGDRHMQHTLAVDLSASASAAAARSTAATRAEKNDVRKLLRLLGVPIVEAATAAVAMCAAMCKANLVYGVATNDMDALAFGAPRVLRHMTAPRPVPIVEINLATLLKELNINMAQFIDLCILCGCDYTPNIRGLDSQTALNLIRTHGSIDRVIDHIDTDKFKVPDDFRPSVAIDFFRRTELAPPATALECGEPDSEGLIAYLVDEKGFDAERVHAAINRLKVARQMNASSSATSSDAPSFASSASTTSFDANKYTAPPPLSPASTESSTSLTMPFIPMSLPTFKTAPPAGNAPFPSFHDRSASSSSDLSLVSGEVTPAPHDVSWVSPLTPPERATQPPIMTTNMQPLQIAHAPTMGGADMADYRTHQHMTSSINNNHASSRTNPLSFPLSMPLDPSDVGAPFGLGGVGTGSSTPWPAADPGLDRSMTRHPPPLETPDEVLTAMLRRNTNNLPATSSSSSAPPPMPSLHSARPIHPLAHSTNSIQTRLDHSRSRLPPDRSYFHQSVDRPTAAREAIRVRFEHDQAWSETLAKVRAEHEAELQAKDKQHVYEQADLLTAFQNDRTEAEKKSQAIINALQVELDQTLSNLASHQALYANFSERIEVELQQLREEVAAAQKQTAEAHDTIREQATHIAHQDANIQRLEHEAESRAQQHQHELQTHAQRHQHELDSHAQHREREIESQSNDRAHWERQLVQQSNDVLRMKEHAFDDERRQREQVMSTLTNQLDTLTQEKTQLETSLRKEEEKSRAANEKVKILEETAKETDSILRAQRELNAEVTIAYKELEKLYHTSQTNVKGFSAGLNRTEAEYQHMEALYHQLTNDSGERITALNQEASHLHELYDQSRRAVDKLSVDLHKAHTDRLALQHAFLDLRRQGRLRKLMCHWICIAQARRWRNREMAFLMNRNVRLDKRAALQRWLQSARLVSAQIANGTLIEHKQTHIAEHFHQLKSHQSKVKAFHAWTRHVAMERQRRRDERRADRERERQAERDAADRKAAEDAAAVAATPVFQSSVEIERNKKVELFHLLQRERAAWSEQRAHFESQLRAGELARHQEQEELVSLHQTMEKMRIEHQQLQQEVQRKLDTDAAVQRAIHDTLLSERQQHQTPILPLPTHTPPLQTASLTAIQYPWQSASTAATSEPPTSSIRGHSSTNAHVAPQPNHSTTDPTDLRHLKYADLQSSKLVDARKDELAGLADCISIEQHRLAMLTQLRQEREAAEYAQTQLSPSKVSRNSAAAATTNIARAKSNATAVQVVPTVSSAAKARAKSPVATKSNMRTTMSGQAAAAIAKARTRKSVHFQRI